MMLLWLCVSICVVCGVERSSVWWHGRMVDRLSWDDCRSLCCCFTQVGSGLGTTSHTVLHHVCSLVGHDSWHYQLYGFTCSHFCGCVSDIPILNNDYLWKINELIEYDLFCISNFNNRYVQISNVIAQCVITKCTVLQTRKCTGFEALQVFVSHVAANTSCCNSWTFSFILF